MPEPSKPIPISRAVGRFFGHIWHATTKPPPPEPGPEVLHQHTEEHEGELEGRRVTLRRTTIEEIEYRDPQ